MKSDDPWRTEKIVELQHLVITSLISICSHEGSASCLCVLVCALLYMSLSNMLPTIC